MLLWQLSILGVECAKGHYDVECVCILILIFSGFVNVSVTELGQKKTKQNEMTKACHPQASLSFSQMMTLAGTWKNKIT